LAERERTRSAGETEALGARLAAGLRPGDVVLVSGELGAGKTSLIRGACRALGVRSPVTSPTFTLGQRYAGEVPVSHLDLFRLGAAGDEEPGLLDEYLGPDAVAFVEWPDLGARLLEPLGDRARVVRVAIRHAGGDEREVSIAGANGEPPGSAAEPGRSARKAYGE
jgi:tRNA threonylcarbamoyladenosine biosynthesis protein TsaE